MLSLVTYARTARRRHVSFRQDCSADVPKLSFALLSTSILLASLVSNCLTCPKGECCDQWNGQPMRASSRAAAYFPTFTDRFSLCNRR